MFFTKYMLTSSVNTKTLYMNSLTKYLGYPIRELDITIPPDYNQNTFLDTFQQENQKNRLLYSLSSFHTKIPIEIHCGFNDNTFRFTSDKLEPNSNYKVSFYELNERITSIQICNLLKKEQLPFVGIYGTAFLLKEKYDSLPKGYKIVAMDIRKNLPCIQIQNSNLKQHALACIKKCSIKWIFTVKTYESPWNKEFCVAVFKKLKQ
jgi:hypothetical protein